MASLVAAAKPDNPAPITITSVSVEVVQEELEIGKVNNRAEQ